MQLFNRSGELVAVRDYEDNERRETTEHAILSDAEMADMERQSALLAENIVDIWKGNH
jgi:hypothetical protein